MTAGAVEVDVDDRGHPRHEVEDPGQLLALEVEVAGVEERLEEVAVAMLEGRLDPKDRDVGVFGAFDDDHAVGKLRPARAFST